MVLLTSVHWKTLSSICGTTDPRIPDSRYHWTNNAKSMNNQTIKTLHRIQICYTFISERLLSFWKGMRKHSVLHMCRRSTESCLQVLKKMIFHLICYFNSYIVTFVLVIQFQCLHSVLLILMAVHRTDYSLLFKPLWSQELSNPFIIIKS
jgi:hypothetical protein